MNLWAFGGWEMSYIRIRLILVCALVILTVLACRGTVAAQQQPQNFQAKDPAQKAAHAAPHVVEAYGKLPLSFEKNNGQTDARVKYLTRGQGYGLFLTPTEAVLALNGASCRTNAMLRHAAPSSLKAESPCFPQNATMRMQMIGANPDPNVSGEDELPGKSNYFIGNDAGKWHTGVPNYAKVRYTNVYPGIDLVYYGNQGQLEFDMVVAPGADPHQLRFKLSGAKKIDLSPEGDLVVHLHGGELRLHKPVVYQAAAEGRKPIDGHYVLKANREVAFETGPYDRSKRLVVDPTLVYSTYIGGTGNDYGIAIAVDVSGNTYIGGVTTSTDFPTMSPFQTAGEDFVTKLNSSGTALIYSTYFGQTTGSNFLEDLAIDGSGNVYLAGEGAGSGFPVVNQISSACDSNCQLGASGGFVTKLNAAGSALVYSSRIGGCEALAIAVDSSGNAYVAGEATTSDFPTVNAFQAASGGSSDAFLLKVNAAGSALDYSTYLGGSGSDQATGVAVDSSGSAYVAGTTNSPNFPTKDQISGSCVGTCGNGTTYDVFVSKFSSTGSALVYSSLIGGSGDDVAAAGNPLYNPNYGHSIAVDASGNAYVGGITDGNPNDFPTTTGAFQTSANCAAACQDGFVTKINAAGNALSYSTFFGTTPSEVNGLAVDSSGDLAITGLFIVPFVNAFYQNGQDAGIAVLDPAGSALLISSSSGHGLGVTFDVPGNVYDAGFTCGNGLLTTTDAFQTTCKSTSGSNAFAAKISLAGNAPAIAFSPTSLTFSSQAVGTTSAGQAINLSNTGSAALDITGITITGTDSADFNQTNTCGTSVAANSSCLITVTFDPTATGSRAASVSVADNAGGSPQTVSLTGAGVAAAPIVTLSPTTGLNFGSQVDGTASAAQNITLTNTGNTTLSITGITITGAQAGDFAETNTCGTSVAASAFCTISVIFDPAASGAATASVLITDNAAGSPQSVSLSGTGVTAAPVVALAPTSLTFGSQIEGTSSTAQTITLTNTGNASLNVSGISITGTNAGDYSQTNTCGTAVAASAKCTISVTFTPTASGTRSASVSIADNAAGSPQSVSLTGTGVTAAPVVVLAPTSLTFATQAIGSSSTAQTITLTNSGNAPLNISGISITGTDSGDFTQTNTCGMSVAMSANCTISVTFTPTAASTRTASVSVADNAGGGPQSVSLSGTATAQPADFGLTISPGSATVQHGGPGIFDVTVTPQNGFDSAVSFACSGAPSGYVCVFSPATVTPSGDAVSTSLSIGEGSASAAASSNSISPMLPGAALACVLCCFVGFRKRRLSMLLLFAVTLGGLGFAITGCGSSMKASTSTVTIAATSGSLQHTATVTFTVE